MQETISVKGFLFNVVRDESGKPVRVAKLKNDLTVLFKLVSISAFLAPFYDSRSGNSVAAGWQIKVKSGGETDTIMFEPILAGIGLCTILGSPDINVVVFKSASSSVNPNFATADPPNEAYEFSFTTKRVQDMLFAQYKGRGSDPTATEAYCTQYLINPMSSGAAFFEIKARFNIVSNINVSGIGAFLRKWNYQYSTSPPYPTPTNFYNYVAMGAMFQWFVPIMYRTFSASLSAGQSVDVTWSVQVS